MQEYLPFILLGVVFFALLVWLAAKGRTSSLARARKLAQWGFTPCPEEAGDLVQRITRLENNSRYRYGIDNPLKGSLGGKVVYYYAKSRKRHRKVTVSEELLFSLARPSAAGLSLFFKPSKLPAGTVTQLIGSVAAGPWDVQPDDLTKLALPRDLQGTNLMAALGPAGTSLYSLIEPATLTVMQQLGDGGALFALCRDDWCRLASAGGRMPFDLERLWPVLRQLLG
ncbi:MAG: hypothetical protein ACE5JI_16690 [Acidobacteriota bacterium]